MIEEGRFSAVALTLSGIAGWHLGWSAEQFWNATPAEMDAVVRAMLDMDTTDGVRRPPSRDDVARLMELYPDG